MAPTAIRGVPQNATEDSMGNSTNDAAGLPGDGERMLPVVGDDDAEVSGDVTLEATVECAFTTGQAGCGKTFLWRERIAADPTAALLCASTGIAAVNLGTVTLNATLRFFDTAS